MIAAKVIADSIHENGPRLITFETYSPKFIDAEIRTHRMLSQNSSSDRAIPFTKMIQGEYYLPYDVRRNQKGMQGYEKVSSQEHEDFQWDMDLLYEDTVQMLYKWKDVIHKQHLNRYLLGFSMQKKVITGTEWENFFQLRMAEDAQPEIRKLAFAMRNAMEKSEPKELRPGEWHLPYVTEKMDIETAIKCSVARCARVSYNNLDGTQADISKDIALHDFLMESRHYSPLEHQATPMKHFEFNKINTDHFTTWQHGVSHMDHQCNLWSGTLRGYIQYRKLMGA
jgi:thymidylate synthase ThyX